MSTVEYRCPICKSRLFAEPGMDNVYKCRIHTDTGMKQSETYVGPNFQWKDEGDTDPKKTGVLTHGTENIKVVRNVVKSKTLTPAEEKQRLRDQYERVTGLIVDRRWGLPRLREEIEKFDRDAYLASVDDGIQESEALLSDGKSGANFAISN